MSVWFGRIVRFLDDESDPPKVLGLQPRIFYGMHDVWEGHLSVHDCEGCELTAWVEMLSCAAHLGLAPGGRPDPATVRFRPAPGLAALAGWGGVPTADAAGEWRHNEALCAVGETLDGMLETTRLALGAVDGDCRKMRQPNCVVARLVEEIDRLRAGGADHG